MQHVTLYYLYAVEFKRVVDKVLEGTPNTLLCILSLHVEEQRSPLPLLHHNALGVVQVLLQREN